jgi:hypothetical protein
LQASSFETETAGHYRRGGPHRRNGVPIDMDGFRDACAAAIAGRHVGEHVIHGHPERVVEFAIREQTSIGRDDGSTKLKHQSAVEIKQRARPFGGFEQGEQFGFNSSFAAFS